MENNFEKSLQKKEQRWNKQIDKNNKNGDKQYRKFLLKLKKRNIRNETDWPEDRFPFFKNLFYKIKTNLCICLGHGEETDNLWELCYKLDQRFKNEYYIVCTWDYNEFYSDWGTSITWQEMVVGKGIFKNWHVYIFQNGN